MSQQTGWTRAKIVEHLQYPVASRAADMLYADAVEIGCYLTQIEALKIQIKQLKEQIEEQAGILHELGWEAER